MSSLCAVCGKASRTVVGDLGFCPDHSEKDLPKSESVEEAKDAIPSVYDVAEGTDYTAAE